MRKLKYNKAIQLNKNEKQKIEATIHAKCFFNLVQFNKITYQKSNRQSLCCDDDNDQLITSVRQCPRRS